MCNKNDIRNPYTVAQGNNCYQIRISRIWKRVLILLLHIVLLFRVCIYIYIPVTKWNVFFLESIAANWIKTNFHVHKYQQKAIATCNPLYTTHSPIATVGQVVWSSSYVISSRIDTYTTLPLQPIQQVVIVGILFRCKSSDTRSPIHSVTRPSKVTTTNYFKFKIRHPLSLCSIKLHICGTLQSGVKPAFNVKIRLKSDELNCTQNLFFSSPPPHIQSHSYTYATYIHINFCCLMLNCWSCPFPTSTITFITCGITNFHHIS